MFIDKMPEALLWRHRDVFNIIHHKYIELLSDHVGKLIAVTAPDDASALIKLVDSSDEDTLLRVISAPESSWRLLWRNGYHANETVQFLIHAFAIDRAVRTAQKGVWGTSALGDFEIRPDGSVQRSPTIDGMMPVDVSSAYAASSDLGGDAETNALPRPSFSSAELKTVLERVRSAGHLIGDLSPVAYDVVKEFTKVLILQKHPIETELSSGTTGQFIGRSVLVNAHIPEATVVDIADLIVHEAIHAVLFMQERHKRWVLRDDLYDSTPRIRSPWSGRVLPLRAFLQATFVWYGLVNFWSSGGRHEVLRTEVREKLGIAASGFLGVSLNDLVSEFAEWISVDILEAMDRMQCAVRSAFEVAFGRPCGLTKL